jgi:hypothetical protein
MMILVKTSAGQQVLKERSVQLTQQQRTALIVIDGKRDVVEVMQSSGAAFEDVRRLVELGLVTDAALGNAPTEPAPLTGRPPPRAQGAR